MSRKDEDEPLVFDHKIIVHKLHTDEVVTFLVTEAEARSVHNQSWIPLRRRIFFHHKDGTAMIRIRAITVLGIEAVEPPVEEGA